MGTDALVTKVKELYASVTRLEEEKYDWEARLGRQAEEVPAPTPPPGPLAFFDFQSIILLTYNIS